MAVYEILIRLYFLGILIASPFSSKAKKWIDGRKNLHSQLASADFARDKWVWFLCSSFGEFQDGKYLMEAFKKQHPEFKILLTFFSSTGIELTKEYTGADFICYLPLDTASNANFFIAQISPRMVFFIRNDIWPNYVHAIAKKNIPVYLAVFALNTQSTFLKFPFQGFYRKVFQKFTGIFVQDPVSEKLLKENSFNENVLTTGNARIDRVLEIGSENFRDEKIENFIGGGFCCMAGSTHIDDRKIFLEAFSQNYEEPIKWIIVPHEIDRRENAEAKKLLGEKMVFYSSTEKPGANTKMLWVDHVGMLAKLYRYAGVVFIGGGFDRGGIHSMQEPLVYGCPVCFGPENRGYKEVTDLIKTGGAEVVHSAGELASFILKYQRDKALLEEVKAANKTYIMKSGGATRRILDYLKIRSGSV